MRLWKDQAPSTVQARSRQLFSRFGKRTPTRSPSGTTDLRPSSLPQCARVTVGERVIASSAQNKQLHQMQLPTVFRSAPLELSVSGTIFVSATSQPRRAKQRKAGSRSHGSSHKHPFSTGARATLSHRINWLRQGHQSLHMSWMEEAVTKSRKSRQTEWSPDSRCVPAKRDASSALPSVIGSAWKHPHLFRTVSSRKSQLLFSRASSHPAQSSCRNPSSCASTLQSCVFNFNFES